MPSPSSKFITKKRKYFSTQHIPEVVALTASGYYGDQMNTLVQKEMGQTPNSLWVPAKHEAMGTSSGSRNFAQKLGV